MTEKQVRVEVAKEIFQGIEKLLDESIGGEPLQNIEKWENFKAGFVGDTKKEAKQK